jgi:hypothetical protein
VSIGTISGRGTADRLGAVDLASRDCIVPLAPTLYLFTSRQVVLTLAHGDEIWAAYGGTLSAESGAITGTYLIYGGTGRFANATGAGTLRGFETLDLATGAGTGRIELRGTLAH